MPVYKSDYDAAKSVLWPQEQVEVTARQRKIGPGGSVIAPTTIVATDRRVIIINRTTLGIRRDIESIPYQRITSVRFENGLISSSIFLRIDGFSSPEGMRGLLMRGKEWGEIDGLSHKDAKAFSDYINKKLAEISARSEMPHLPPQQAHYDTDTNYGTGSGEVQVRRSAGGGGSSGGGSSGGYVYCPACGFKNALDAHYCMDCGKKLKG